MFCFSDSGTRRQCGILALLFSAVLIPAALRAQEKTIVWNFDNSLTSSLGGNYNTFSREPSWARIYLDPAVHLPPSGHSLRITVHRAATGFCGLWANFYPDADNPAKLFNASPYHFLTFWIKGDQAGGGFYLKLIDQKGESNEDAQPSRPLRAYLPRGITTFWQKAWIPLSDFPGVDPGTLARIVLIFSQPGDYRFYLDNIGFEAAKTPAEVPGSMKIAKHPAYSLRDSSNTMWVWQTQALWTDPSEPARLFAFCARMNVRQIYLSVDFPGASQGQVPSTVANPDRLRALIEEAHRHKLRIQALAGTPEWALAAHHEDARGAVAAILDFNRASPPAARFDGIHFDVEPYVLIGFEDLPFRRKLLEQFLSMVSLCSRAARAGRLPFSCDVPWWFFPAAGSPDRQAMTIAFNGSQKTVGEHLVDLLGTVTIMDYRNQACGASGIINYAGPAMAYAATHHKKIVVGLETSAEEPTPVDFVLAMPTADFESRFSAAGLLGVRSFHGFELHGLASGGTVFIGLGMPQPQRPQPTQPIAQALTELRQAVGATANEYPVEPSLNLANANVAADPEWTSFAQETFAGAPGSTAISGFQAVNRTAPSITFDGLSQTVFEEEAGSVEEWIGQAPGFGGLGLHYYTSLRTLMNSQ